jgi:hypothetical protein
MPFAANSGPAVCMCTILQVLCHERQNAFLAGSLLVRLEEEITGVISHALTIVSNTGPLGDYCALGRPVVLAAPMVRCHMSGDGG